VKGLTLTDPAVGQPAKAAEGQELTLEQLLTLMQALDQRGMTADVSLLDMSDPAQLTLRYLGRFDVQLPREADYGYKLDYLMAVVEKLEVNEKGVINMMQEGKARFIPE
ncbi:MAG: cell division protein FtsQ/DivIB, partial [Oscillospiraceae bacterium]|nr:cell division protein FtsQ/DivIB [Oscillospiraceae bacterium]